MTAWACDQVRLTAFYSAKVPLDGGPTIEATFGVQPQSVEIKPPEASKSETASLGAGTLQLNVKLNRVDWIWSAPIELVTEGKGLGTDVDALREFARQLETWLSGQKNIIRLAIGGGFSIKVSSKEEGYTTLQTFLKKVTIDPKGSEDFSYQINYPTSITLSDRAVRINRLSRWTCRRHIFGALQIADTVVSAASTETLSYHAHIELDINSDAHNQEPLSDTNTIVLLHSLEGLAIDILRGKEYA